MLNAYLNLLCVWVCVCVIHFFTVSNIIRKNTYNGIDIFHFIYYFKNVSYPYILQAIQFTNFYFPENSLLILLI